MVEVPYLSPTDKVEGRAFTNPEQIPNDMNTLRYMTDQVGMFLRTPHLYQALERPIIVHRPDRKQWSSRFVIPNPERLTGGEPLAFVGFMGSRRADANLSLGDEFDEILVSEIPDHPDLLCYHTMALICGNFCNLVLFANERVKEDWARSKAHAQAVGKLSPEYYRSIRLYNGRMPAGVSDSQTMYLTKVKYFDYEEEPMWRAVRSFEAVDSG